MIVSKAEVSSVQICNETVIPLQSSKPARSFEPTLPFSILAFLLLCTSRLPSFFAYQIEANMMTREIIIFCGLQ